MDLVVVPESRREGRCRERHGKWTPLSPFSACFLLVCHPVGAVCEIFSAGGGQRKRVPTRLPPHLSPTAIPGRGEGGGRRRPFYRCPRHGKRRHRRDGARERRGMPFVPFRCSALGGGGRRGAVCHRVRGGTAPTVSQRRSPHTHRRHHTRSRRRGGRSRPGNVLSAERSGCERSGFAYATRGESATGVFLLFVPCIAVPNCFVGGRK